MAKKTSELPGYDAYRESQAKLARERSAEGRDIGKPPKIRNTRRRSAAGKSLLQFCLTYFPARFPWPFSDAHKVAIERMERCVLNGGRFTLAMPRGSGKTTVAECALLWAVLYGFRRFVLLVSANDPLATNSLKKVQKELETNDLLLEDFPEVCYPIRKLERINHRAKGQTSQGEPTRIEWTNDGIILPMIKGSKASGAVIRVAGIEGAIRGLSVVGPLGEILRPDLVLIDDAQTRASAKSPTQTTDREAVIGDDIIGLAGPEVSIAAVQLCTVIYPGDLSDRFLSHEKHPDWQGLRTKMLESFPTDMDWWDGYAEIRRESLRSGDEGKRANEHYLANRAQADAGAKVSWESRFKAGEVSAIQSAMNLYYDSPKGFLAEYQNEPEQAGIEPGAKELERVELTKRLTGLERGIVRKEATTLTAFIDMGGGFGRGMWWAVCDWDQTFGGSVIDYGAWPRQNRTNFAADDMRPGLLDAYPGFSLEQALYKGLEELTASILGRRYPRQDTGEMMPVDRCLIDSGWQPSTVYQFIRSTEFKVFPSKGVGRSETARGVAEWRPRPGEKSGFHWRLTVSESGRGRMVQFDPDAWKSFVFERLTTPIGPRGAMRFYGKNPYEHEMISEHCWSETSIPKTLRGSTFDKWTQRPHRPDNHLWDCLIGCAVAASVEGITFASSTAVPSTQQPAKPKLKFSEQYAQKHGGKR